MFIEVMRVKTRTMSMLKTIPIKNKETSRSRIESC